MALVADLAPSTARAALQQIIEDLRARDWQQTAGDIGHAYVIRALAAAGRSDVLHRVYRRTGPGSYGGILAKGLTAMPETWDAIMDGYQSLDHCMLGHVVEWYFGYVGGIRQATGSVGWQRVLVAPAPGPLTWAETSIQTPRGRVACRWRRQHGVFRLEAELPPDMTGTAILPSGRIHPLRPGRQTFAEEDAEAPAP